MIARGCDFGSSIAACNRKRTDVMRRQRLSQPFGARTAVRRLASQCRITDDARPRISAQSHQTKGKADGFGGTVFGISNLTSERRR